MRHPLIYTLNAIGLICVLGVFHNHYHVEWWEGFFLGAGFMLVLI